MPAEWLGTGAPAVAVVLGSISYCGPALRGRLLQVYLGGIEAQALDGLQKGLDGVIAGSKLSMLCSTVFAIGQLSCRNHMSITCLMLTNCTPCTLSMWL